MNNIEILSKYTEMDILSDGLILTAVALLAIIGLVGLAFVWIEYGFVPALFCTAIYIISLTVAIRAIPKYECYKVTVNEYAKLTAEQQLRYVIYETDGPILCVYDSERGD